MERKIECPAIEIHSSLTKCDCPEAAALCSRALLFPKSKNFQRPAWACPARQRCFAPGLRLPASASALGAGLASCWPRPQQLLPVSATGGGRRRCPLDKRPQLFYNKIIPTKGGVPMRFLHLSDLHLGKRVCEFSMLDDQRYILEQVLSLLDARPVDASGISLYRCGVSIGNPSVGAIGANRASYDFRPIIKRVTLCRK